MSRRTFKLLRSRPRLFEPEELLPDVTRRIGKPLRYLSAADRAAMERLIAKLAESERRAA